MGQASTAHMLLVTLSSNSAFNNSVPQMVAKKYMFSLLYLLTCRSNNMPKNHWTFGILFDSVQTIASIFASLEWHNMI